MQHIARRAAQFKAVITSLISLAASKLTIDNEALYWVHPCLKFFTDSNDKRCS